MSTIFSPTGDRSVGGPSTPTWPGRAWTPSTARDAPSGDVAWLGRYPDTGFAGNAAGPGARYEQRAAVELAFVAALQRFPDRW